MKNSIPFILILTCLYKPARAQNHICFVNETGLEVAVQKRTILEIGAFPYILSKSKDKIETIPFDTNDPVMLNISLIVPKQGYGTSTGIYYLFKLNDTVVIRTDKANRPMVSHISSVQRTKELQFITDLMDNVAVTPYYTLMSRNLKLYLKERDDDTLLPQRDRFIDSLIRPFIQHAETLCKEKNIDPVIGKLYSYLFLGMLHYNKLDVSHMSKNAPAEIAAYYRDSIPGWSNAPYCNDCANLSFYNLAMYSMYQNRFGDLPERVFLDTVSSKAGGYLKDFISSRYVVAKFPKAEDGKELVAYYDKLDIQPVYKKTVHDNLLLLDQRFDTNDSDRVMNADKQGTGFDDLIAKYKGKIIYIDFWASWCKPCVEELPYSHDLRKKITDENIAMVYISMDEDLASWKEANNRFELPAADSYILINSFKANLAKKLGLNSIPRYIIINKKGKIINQNADRPSDRGIYRSLVKLAGE